ncbi:MAG TPA: hypothetical protein ENK16_02635 [Chromatiales bacterium]|nr:hypothetical protein [Chromatiales bacterium]
MKVYHCSKSRSVRVIWMLEELGLEYELETMPFGPEGLQSADYLAINPFGKVPVLVDGALTMSESVAIIQYLLDRYADGRLQPDPDSPEYGRFLQWLHFGESTMMGPVATIARYTVFCVKVRSRMSMRWLLRARRWTTIARFWTRSWRLTITLWTMSSRRPTS